MTKLLESLYNGDIRPEEQIVPHDPAYRSLMYKIDRERAYIRELLGAEHAERLDKLSDYRDQESSMAGFAGFAYGFRLGMRLMCEALDDEGGVG